ncbi:MAG: cytochrome c [Bacteroidota bacterium]
MMTKFISIATIGLFLTVTWGGLSSAKEPTKPSVILLQPDPKAESIKRGKLIYDELCMTCHLPSGEGVAPTFPPLAGSDYLLKNLTESIRGIKYGQKGKITVNGKTYDGNMPSMGLNDKEVADVTNYILNTWGNTYKGMITAQQVANIKK